MAVANPASLPPLLRLPCEISSQIFSYLIAWDEIEVVIADRILRQYCKQPNIMVLLLVHPLITGICLRLVYEHSLFSFKYPAAVKNLTNVIGPFNNSLIKHASVTDIQYARGGRKLIGNPSLASTNFPSLHSCVLRIIARDQRRARNHKFHRLVRDAGRWSQWKIDRLYKMVTIAGGSLYNGTVIGKKGSDDLKIYRSDIKPQLSPEEYEIDIRKVVQAMKDEKARRSRERYHKLNPTARWKNPVQKKLFEEGDPEEQEVQIKEEPDT